MKNFKGFASIPALANNLPGQTGNFGELSPAALTFSRNKTNYVSPTINGIELIGFSAKTDVGVTYTPTNGLIAHILSVIEWVRDQNASGSIPANINKADFIDDLSNAFPGLMTAIEINEIIVGSPISSKMPDYVKWVYSDAGQDHELKIWFVNSRFESQYDEYEILLVPPIDDIDDLNATTGVVTALIGAVTPAQILNKVVTAAGGVPYTTLVPYNLIWNSPTVPGSTVNTTWTVIAYGPGAQDTDNIKDAIRSYITANTALASGIWNTLYPSLYAENEFIVVPLWQNIAVPESGLDVELYNASAKVGELISIATDRIPDSYAASVTIATYLNSNLYVANAFFQSLTFLTVGNPNNVGSVWNFEQKFPDYTNIQPSSPDWLRMSVVTRDFIVWLNDALEKAIDLTATSTVPPGFTRVTRDGKIYLSFTYDGFNYLVLSKGSYAIA